ncbi:hypothetical protein ACSV9I_04470 [Rhizobium sp. G187]|uniref:hypothetical protein n=1 Tax=Rhizobium sp. G187 TaxID=3451352 RepID=UPI003EE7326E
MNMKRRLAIDPADLDAIMDRIAEKRQQPVGHLRSLQTGQEWLQVRDEDGQLRQVPLN